ncbi:flagellar hook protein FlgE [Thermoclostridium stercorarium subsp. stercorarium DSM 8532]|jgi:flagellar hook protein FlgE|uniref:Flagellar hook protein FlgE n=3 Tax=Thermoclostridium stercorarium TaxID=1510 RepID=L7VPT4_THES1|nr:flagellar hook protein FlgE [Thermoclostridium stercorarium]AGC67593.1 flagellar hook protein FlgE [Thermoclostridium stercorarium subsp. stercorarium DSM 8532]AGI38643.1 flagellar hook-basal body protein [Thermoclostridium stercorarium subsp. stercorarium DSM 8532]ANW98015.1 flagellar biosynthesis protein FlgE [Thermoclostridium stercorarium subsp. thermolacticum DSM 2910]ANX00563.1 flagellar biosynthesis protein FlgE [Thermoclostridium stercorarium subsp. leptospartum DSM 9219]
MMRSMFSSVSGLKAHQTKMDVIGNNIANVNTVAFKASRVTFAEIFAQTVSGASAPDPDTGRGGTNPVQIGLGMNVNSIDTLMTRGSLQRTDNPTDLSIDGEGFFIVRNGNEGTYMFTRAGNFTIDKLGNLVTADGLNVLGWQKYTVDDNGNYIFDTEEELTPINLYEDEYNLNKRVLAAKATTQAVLAGNLDATNTTINSNNGQIIDTNGDQIPEDGEGKNYDAHFIVPLSVYDALGNEYKLNISFWKTYVDTSGSSPQTIWYYRISASGAGFGDSGGDSAASGYIKFDSKGKIITDDSNYSVTPQIKVTPDPSVGTDSFTFELNLGKLTMYATDSSVKPTQVDGYPPGTLEAFSIGSDGVIVGVYSNGKQQPLGMVAIAVFDNAAGLQRMGNNLFIATSNSGDFTRALKPGTEGAGSLNPGTLEMSNVDLAQEFTEMIITQRGFQANSRVITASDEMLQELANLKR